MVTPFGNDQHWVPHTMNGCPLVLIPWLDSRQRTSAWRFLADVGEPKAVECATVGWLLRRPPRQASLNGAIRSHRSRLLRGLLWVRFGADYQAKRPPWSPCGRLEQKRPARDRHSQFERETLVDRHCELFGIWPELSLLLCDCRLTKNSASRQIDPAALGIFLVLFSST